MSKISISEFLFKKYYPNNGHSHEHIIVTTKETIEVEHKYTIDITQNKVAESKTNEIKLKDIKLEVNNPLSVDVKDYLENTDKIETNIINALKLDTSDELKKD